MQLDFPDYFGHNLDALNDCMREISIPDEGGRCLVFDRFDAAAKSFGDFAWHVLDIFANQSHQHLLVGKRLLVILQSDDPQPSFQPIGCTSPRWNPREWMNKDRGL